MRNILLYSMSLEDATKKRRMWVGEHRELLELLWGPLRLTMEYFGIRRAWVQGELCSKLYEKSPYLCIPLPRSATKADSEDNLQIQGRLDGCVCGRSSKAGVTSLSGNVFSI